MRSPIWKKIDLLLSRSAPGFFFDFMIRWFYEFNINIQNLI